MFAVLRRSAIAITRLPSLACLSVLAQPTLPSIDFTKLCYQSGCGNYLLNDMSAGALLAPSGHGNLSRGGANASTE